MVDAVVYPGVTQDGDSARKIYDDSLIVPELNTGSNPVLTTGDWLSLHKTCKRK